MDNLEKIGERGVNEVRRNLYENKDGREMVEVDERLNEVKLLNLRRYNGKIV